MQGGGIRRAIHKQQTIINEYLASPNGRLTGCPVCLSRCRLASIPYDAITLDDYTQDSFFIFYRCLPW